MEDQRAIKPGSRVSSYLVETVLGHGGMGVVYSATEVETHTQVALKTVNAVRADRLGQIRREAQALMKLRHPGLVGVLDQGVHDGCPWYAMPLVEGQTLEDLIPALFASKPVASELPTAPTLVTTEPVLTTEMALGPPSSTRPLPWETTGEPLREIAGGQLARVLGLTQRLCEVLAYVHGEGVVHRDIKPANVFVSREGTPLLVDFGLAIQTAGSEGREVLDGGLATAGSVRYMAPEQIRGELLDARCDLYAMGCLLFELLTGRHVFEGHHQEVIRRQLHSSPPELSECVSGAPQELAQLLRRLLSKDRRERPGYARDVAAQLARVGATCPDWSSPPPRAKTYLYRPPMVGREELVRQLEGVVARPLSARRDIVFLMGESGAGKTRLALELAGLASARGMAVVTSTCAALAGEVEEGTPVGQASPLAALKPLLHAISDVCRERGPAAASELLGPHARLLSTYVPELVVDDPRPQGGAVVGSSDLDGDALPPALARHRLFTALTETFAAFARSKPTMLIIDDLQWADELSVGALKHFGSSTSQDVPLVVVATVRTEERTPSLAEMIAADWSLSVELERLQGNDVRRMVMGMLCMDQEPEAFVDFLAEKSEGNPFFIAEYLRTAVAEQILVKNDEGHWCLANSTQPTRVLCEALPLPGSMRDLVERRLGQVSARARPVVDGAAALGREFEPVLLSQALGLDAAAAEEAFDELISRHVLEPVGTGDALRFTHDKLREVPYASLSTERRRELHARIAAALEAAQSEHSGEVDHAALGRHWMEANEPARSLPFLIRAGNLARQAYAMDRAIECFRKALHAATTVSEAALGTTSEFEPSSVAEILGDLLALRGSHSESRKALQDAIRIPGGTVVDRARRLRKIGKTWETEHNHESALQAYNDAEHTLERVDAKSEAWHSEWVEMNLHRVRVFYWLAKLDEMDELVKRVHPFIEAHGSPLQQSNYYQALVTRDFRLHRYVISAETLENARLSLRAAAASEAPVETAFARFVYGMALLFHGNLAEAQTELSGAREATRKQGDVTAEMRSLAYLLVAHRRAQHQADVAVLAAETLTRATALAMNDYVGVAEASLGWLAFKQGRSEQALVSSQKALDSWAKLSFAYPFQWNAVLTLLAIRIDRAPLRELVQLAEKLLLKELAGLPPAIADSLSQAATAHARGDSSRAHDELQSAVSHALALGYL